MADDIREELRFICHTEGYNEAGELDGHILADAILASPVIARIRAEASRDALTEARDRYVENSVPWIQFDRALERLSIRSGSKSGNDPTEEVDQ